MEDIRITIGVGEVRDDILERYENVEAGIIKSQRSKRKMKVALTASLSLFLALCVLIPLLPLNNTEPPMTVPAETMQVSTALPSPTGVKTTEPIPPETNTKDGYVFISYGSESNSPVKEHGFDYAQKHGLFTFKTFEKIDNTPTTFISPVTGAVLDYKYSDCKYKDDMKTEFGSHYSIFDVYYNNDEKIEVLHGTDLIVYYSADYPDNENESVENAINIADDFLKTILPEDISQKFKASGVGGGFGFFEAVVYYPRTLHGYDTDETLCVYIGKSGKVEGYNGFSLCKFDSIRETVTKEQIDKAYDTLLEKLKGLNLNSFFVESVRLTTNTEGELYLQIAYQYKHEDGARAETAVINVI